jgi:hypothetical protein
MKLSALFVAALAATAEALVQFTMSDVNVQAGKAFNLTWSGNVGPVTITLKNGPPTALVDVMVIDCKLLFHVVYVTGTWQNSR